MLRQSPRAALLWGAALLTAVVTAVVVGGDLSSLHRRAHVVDRAVPVVVAARDLALGSIVTAEDVRLVRQPRSTRPDSALAHLSDARGRIVRTPVLIGTPVLARHLAAADRRGLDAAIPVGMRAMRVVVQDGLRPPPGSTVDVLVTFDPTKVPADTDPTLVVARSALVVTVEVDGDGNLTGERATRRVAATLLVTSDEAPRLAFAATSGVLTLALTPPEEACCPPTTTSRTP